MLVDAYSWVPVNYNDLKVGMKFERAITMEQREALAKFTTMISHNTQQAAAEAAKPGEK